MLWKNMLIGLLLLGVGVLLGALIVPGFTVPTDEAHPSAEVICVEHRVPEDVCTRCHPDLIQSFKERGDWCAGHGVPETQCALCNPTVADRGVLPAILASDGETGSPPAPGEEPGPASGVICSEHRVPEDVCTRCNPDLIQSFKKRGDWCAGHGVPETQCALCNPMVAERGVLPAILDRDEETGRLAASGEERAPASAEPISITGDSPADTRYPGLSVIYRTNQPLCPTDQAIIQFASVETAERAGLEIQSVLVAPSAPTLEAPAEIVFDQNTTTTLTSTLPIIVTRWLREPGTEVRAGDVIAAVESPDMALLQGEYLEAHADWQIHDREQKRATALLARGLLDSASYDRASADAVAAEARLIQNQSRLQLAGLADLDLAQLREQRNIVSRFGLRATKDGVLLERIAPLGLVLEPGTALARIGDPAALWIEARIRLSDLPRVSLGQEVVFTADGNALRRASGTVIWISQFLDPHSRTATMRAKPDEGTGMLRAHEFGRVAIANESVTSSVLVPRDAVQWEGCCNVVFVREAPDRFRPRKVTLARGTDGYYRILDGLQPGEQVVVGGSFLLKTELKKGSIGAGCCPEEAPS